MIFDATNSYIKKLEAGQTFWDLCIQEYGTIEMGMQLWLDNNGTGQAMDGLTLNDAPAADSEFIIREKITEGDAAVMTFFRDKNVIVKTGPII
jgi:hypothetical protein